MRLNPECIRDLMLFCEENTYIDTTEVENLLCASYHVLYVDSMRRVPPLNAYEAGEVLYHVIQLSESGYIMTDFKFDPQNNFRKGNLPCIYYVTPKGHEFIAKITEKKSWEKVSKILRTLGGVSLSVIEAVSRGVADAALSKCIAAQAGQ